MSLGTKRKLDADKTNGQKDTPAYNLNNKQEQSYDSNLLGITEKRRKTSVHAYSPFEKVTKLRKISQIANLLRDLEDILDDNSRDIATELLGEDSVFQCSQLRSNLLKKQYTTDAESNTNLNRQLPLNEDSKLAKIISPLSISPWKSTGLLNNFPLLPEIMDPTLETAAFIHCSAGAGHKGALNYEQLELIGDAYMELISTLLISQTFPNLSPGKQSQIREMLIKNITLANYSLHYNFDKRLKMDWALLHSTPLTKVKVLGDVFEAYVAAIILSDPLNGLLKACDWLKDLWGVTIADTIREEEKSEKITSSPLWQLRGNLTSEKVAEAFNNRPIQLNAKEKLQKLIGHRNAKLTYKEIMPPSKDPATKLALFTMGVYLNGWGESNKLLGSGKANGKKEAGVKAAAMALEDEKLIKIYADKKTALRELEDSGN
ncbi:unnamed protein product [Blumeria hordei]|uniref:Uncharacterized protein n=2 Tax=Blumeria hordei TaxID=2867405 RepID=A0A383UXH1_BLUHO|nr:ribonuclease [Blumeria hordei DH14]SZF05011.1 unnamed protein product [Blumeria hordei]